MATRAPFLTTRFGGYYHRDVPKEDAELTHVGPGTPCGEYLRRFWQPICFSDDLRDLPLRVTILGEDLVAFRDLRGVPVDQRQMMLNSERYGQNFSPEERGILSNLLRVEPYQPASEPPR